MFVSVCSKQTKYCDSSFENRILLDILLSYATEKHKHFPKLMRENAYKGQPKATGISFGGQPFVYAMTPGGHMAFDKT